MKAGSSVKSGKADPFTRFVKDNIWEEGGGGAKPKVRREHSQFCCGPRKSKWVSYEFTFLVELSCCLGELANVHH